MNAIDIRQDDCPYHISRGPNSGLLVCPHVGLSVGHVPKRKKMEPVSLSTLVHS